MGLFLQFPNLPFGKAKHLARLFGFVWYFLDGDATVSMGLFLRFPHSLLENLSIHRGSLASFGKFSDTRDPSPSLRTRLGDAEGRFGFVYVIPPMM
jgi:hypothetical protein